MTDYDTQARAEAWAEGYDAGASGELLPEENPYWAAGRAETTTATTEDAHVLAVLNALHPKAAAPSLDYWGTEADKMRAALRAAGLLATARTRPTREQIAKTIHSVTCGLANCGMEYGAADEVAANKVLALLNHDQPTEAEAGARAVEDTAHILRRMELNGMHLTDMDISGWLHERAARIRGGDDRG